MAEEVQNKMVYKGGVKQSILVQLPSPPNSWTGSKVSPESHPLKNNPTRRHCICLDFGGVQEVRHEDSDSKLPDLCRQSMQDFSPFFSPPFQRRRA